MSGNEGFCNFCRFYSQFFKSEKTDCTAHFKCGQKQVSLTCNMLTGGIFTSKLTFLFSAYARRESRICEIEIHLRKTARSLFSFLILRAVLVRDFG